MAGISPKRQRFIEEYLIDLNATQAAIRAGYSKQTAYSQAHDLLKNPEIQEAITKARDERTEAVGLTVEEILRGIKETAVRAHEEGQYAAALKGYELAGKYHKLFTDRIEHSVALTVELQDLTGE